MGLEEKYPFFSQVKYHPEVIAHRGGNGQWPGETMAAYKGAMSLGVDVLEMDVYLTSDAELILMHDEDVDGTTDGEGRVYKFSLADIQKLNAGYHWSPDYHVPLADLPEELRADLRVPSLKEVLDAYPQTRMVIEMKPAKYSPALALCNLLRERKMTDKVLVASFKPSFMKEFRDLCPEVPTSLSPSPAELAQLFLGVGWPHGQNPPSVLEAAHHLITEDLVKLARKRGMKIHAWTVNDLDQMIRMRDVGVDGIITDYPGPLMALLGRVKGIT